MVEKDNQLINKFRLLSLSTEKHLVGVIKVAMKDVLF